ncbi:MAG: aminotransferase class III-fold pyridoxal phosphate-dependent enzyme [Edaphobacter sp.]
MAAVLVEPIVGTNGVIVPPDEYMPKLRKICDEYGVLLIADEVMTGWGAYRGVVCDEPLGSCAGYSGHG